MALRQEIREAHPDYHAAPVAPWGNRSARLLIVGLAPGMHGANRTGQPFTGDASGEFLFRLLHRHGFATAPDADDARLIGVRITNAVKCLPPENRPLAAELKACQPYLEAELHDLIGTAPRRNRVVLCLGHLAHDAVMRALNRRDIRFEHGRCSALRPQVWLADTYHPSRQNTNTGRLTEQMLSAVLERARGLLAS